MPVRRVANRGRNIIGRFPSLKLKRMVDYESLIERDLLYLLDFEPSVIWYTEQPLTIPYEDQVGERRYTPDFLVSQGDDMTLVECKPQAFIDTAINQRKFAAARAWCATRGWTFQIFSDAERETGYRLQNVKQLTQFARYRVASQLKREIDTFLRTTLSQVTMTEVLGTLAPHNPQSLIIPIWHMAFHHELRLPIDEAPLSTAMVVKPAEVRNGYTTV